MADFELRADYDHDGRVSGSSSEYDARTTAPGAILVGNIDADKRAFPNQATSGPDPKLDYQQTTKSGTDDELLALSVMINNPAAGAGRQFGLRIPETLAGRIRLYDDKGNAVPANPGMPYEFPLTLPNAAKLDLQLEYTTLPGSPFGRKSGLGIRYTPGQDQELLGWALQLFSRKGQDASVVHDSGLVTLAPVFFPDNGVTATRIYICDRPHTNASLTDLREALKAIKDVELVTVGKDITEGDTWLQDQFQPGLVIGPDGWRHVIIHMPRLRSDSDDGLASTNLAGFVTSHFPAHDVCLLNDFWDRKLSFMDLSATTFNLTIQECVQISVNMGKVFEAIKLMNAISKVLDKDFQLVPLDDWWEARGRLDEILADFEGRLRKAPVKASSEWQEVLKIISRDLNTRIKDIGKNLPNGQEPNTVELKSGNKSVVADKDLALKLYKRLTQMRSSGNYGGNVESSPPVGDAVFGKIIIGNRTINKEREHVDVDLLRFLNNQMQPVVQLDTTWLDVGHIDEVLTFVPDLNGPKQRFAALRASSGLAMSILRGAIAQYESGIKDLGTAKVPPFPSGVAPRLMTEGTAPVTRLMRGKLWSQSLPHPSDTKVPDIMTPPRIYQHLARIMTGGDPLQPNTFKPPSLHDIHYWPADDVPRAFPADITPYELVWAEKDETDISTNDYVESQYLTPLASQVEDQLGGPRVIPVPVVFDRVPDVDFWKENPWDAATSAFTPDVVNLQNLNGHLLIPRPYGPRMIPADVVTVLTDVLKEVPYGQMLQKELSEKMFSKYGLDVPLYWVNRQPSITLTTPSGLMLQVFGGIMNAQDLAKFFLDGFPGKSEADVAKKIAKDNPRSFAPDGRLREGWQQLFIDEGTVDLFEAYIQLVVNSLGLTVHWVDSWFYHTHLGGIHCGTNVLRVPEKNQLPIWW